MPGSAPKRLLSESSLRFGFTATERLSATRAGFGAVERRLAGFGFARIGRFLTGMERK